MDRPTTSPGERVQQRQAQWARKRSALAASAVVSREAAVAATGAGTGGATEGAVAGAFVAVPLKAVVVAGCGRCGPPPVGDEQAQPVGWQHVHAAGVGYAQSWVAAPAPIGDVESKAAIAITAAIGLAAVTPHLARR
jgi:hypothetical protein